MLLLFGVVIVASQGYQSKERHRLLGPVRVALLARAALILGHRQRGIVEQLLQNPARVAKERLAQAELDGLQIAHSLLPPLGLD